MEGLSFRCYDIALGDTAGAFVGEFSAAVNNYRQEWIEGPDLCSFVFIEGNGDVTDASLRAWFERRLMYRVEVVSDGVVVFDGFIHDMELQRESTHWMKSIEDMSNAITATYVDTNGDLQYITDDDGEVKWITDDESITLYGRRERVISVNSEDEDEALERAETELKYRSSPYSVPPAWRSTRDNRLNIQCVGRARLANSIKLLAENLRLTPAHEAHNNDDTVDSDDKYQYRNFISVGGEIKRILEVIQHYGGWLYPQDIYVNNNLQTTTKMGVPRSVGAWDRILELSRLRDRNDSFYQLLIAPDGGVTYQVFDETPEYYFKPDPSRIVLGDESSPTWNARPGIVRVLDAAIGPSLPDTWLSDNRNIYAERVTMREGDEMASFHTRKYNVTDYLRAVESQQRWMRKDRR